MLSSKAAPADSGGVQTAGPGEGTPGICAGEGLEFGVRSAPSYVPPTWAPAYQLYSGLDPSVHQYGEKNHRGRISKNGTGDLRHVLVQAAHQVATHDLGPLGAFFRRKEKHLGRRRLGLATARKLPIVAWKTMLTGEAYRSCKEFRYREKLRALRCHAAEDLMIWVQHSKNDSAKSTRRLQGATQDIPGSGGIRRIDVPY